MGSTTNLCACADEQLASAPPPLDCLWERCHLRLSPASPLVSLRVGALLLVERLFCTCWALRETETRGGSTTRLDNLDSCRPTTPCTNRTDLRAHFLALGSHCWAYIQVSPTASSCACLFCLRFTQVHAPYWLATAPARNEAVDIVDPQTVRLLYTKRPTSSHTSILDQELGYHTAEARAPAAATAPDAVLRINLIF